MEAALRPSAAVGPEDPMDLQRAIWTLRTLDRGHPAVVLELLAAAAVLLAAVNAQLGDDADLQDILDEALAIVGAEEAP